MKNVIGKPLDALQPFIGEWAIEGRHIEFPDTVIRGASVFEWWGDRTFLIHRATLDHPMLRGYVITGDFEAVLNVALGLDDVVGFRVGEIPGAPGRVYVDVAA